jgi:hypothetical protein
MRTLPAALVIAAALHAGAMAYVQEHRRHAPAPTPAHPAEDAITDVVLLDDREPEVPIDRGAKPRATLRAASPGDDHTPVAPAPRDTLRPPPLSHPPRAPATHAGGPARLAATTAPALAPAAGEAPAPGEPPAHSRYMTMRQPELEHGLPQGFVDDFLSRSPAPAGDAEAATLAKAEHDPELHPSGGGTYTSDHETFTAHVARDGTVHFDDKPDVGDFHFAGIGFAGRMSVDDWIMRRTTGQDPYSSAKRQWLDKTRDERAAIARMHRTEDLERAPELMQQNLVAMWQRVRDPAARREALFELWDECAEGEGVAGAAGERARAMVIGWIGSHLPRGQPGAFSADEIARLDARRASKQHFAPY